MKGLMNNFANLRLKIHLGCFLKRFGGYFYQKIAKMIFGQMTYWNIRPVVRRLLILILKRIRLKILMKRSKSSKSGTISTIEKVCHQKSWTIIRMGKLFAIVGYVCIMLRIILLFWTISSPDILACCQKAWRQCVQGVPITTGFFQRRTALLLQKLSDLKNFITFRSAMNWLLCGYHM